MLNEEALSYYLLECNLIIIIIFYWYMFVFVEELYWTVILF
jgi:hypothetical protein